MELNMRGLHTTVRAIRRRVFTEVAKLGFNLSGARHAHDGFRQL